MPHTWYVTFETPKPGLISNKRRSPLTTKTFATEAEAKAFARAQREKEIAVTGAGTINPQFPKQIISSSEMSVWLGTDHQV